MVFKLFKLFLECKMFVIILLIMSTKCFKVKYYLQYLQARSSPLFTNIRAYLITDSGKRLISEIHSAKDKKIIFQAYFQDQRCKMAYESESRRFEDKNIVILLQFGAEDRFIKMGQANINIANLLNQHQNASEVLPYKLDKCYDRNARIFVGITFISNKPNGVKEQKVQQISHSRSQCLIPPPRIKMRTIHQRNNFYPTQYSQFTEREEQEEVSETSHKFHLNGARTLNRTQIFKKNSNVITHNQQIIDLKTQNRIYQHQIGQAELRERELTQQAQHLKQFISKYKNQNSRLASQLEEAKKQLAEKDVIRQTLREQLNADIARTLKLYQESEQERNKLLIERDQQSSEQKNHVKDLQKKILEQKNKNKAIQKSQQAYRTKIEEYMARIAIYQTQLKSQQKNRQAITQALQSHQKYKQALQVQLTNHKREIQKIKKEKDQSQSQLEISHFSLEQLKKQNLQLKRLNKDLVDKSSYLQTELRTTNQTMKLQRSNYSRRLQQIEREAELQQLNREAYLQEIQVKTINEHSKNNQISVLRKEINKLKNELVQKVDFNEQLQSKVRDLTQINSEIEGKMQDYQHKMIELSRENAMLQNQLVLYQEKEINRSEATDEGNSQRQRDQLIKLRYQERDEYWKKQIEQIQKDTKVLIQKIKKEKEDNLLKLNKSNQDYRFSQQHLKKAKVNIKDLTDQIQMIKKGNKQYQKRLLEMQKKKNEQIVQRQRLQQKVKYQQKRLLQIEQLEEQLTITQQNSKQLKSSLQEAKAELQKQRGKSKKLRSQIKEMVNTTCSYFSKSQKQRIMYDQLSAQNIDTQTLLSFNSAAKLFCDRHNKLKMKLEQLQDAKRQLQQKQDKQQKVNKSVQSLRKSRGSCDSQSSINQSMLESTTQFIPVRNPPSRVSTQKDQYEIRTLKLQIEQLKAKLRRQSNRCSEFEKEANQLNQKLEEREQFIKKIKQQFQETEQKFAQNKERLKLKEKQLQATKHQLKQMADQIYSLKKQLQQSHKMIKQQKSQQILKRTTVRQFNSHHQKSMDQSFSKAFELQKKLKSTQQQLERLKKESRAQKNDSSQTRELKAIQARLKEKEETIINLRDSLQEEREKGEQLKQLHALKLRKLKEQFQEQMQAKCKIEKQLTYSLSQKQQKLRQIQKKLKIAEQNLKNANNQLAFFGQKEQKGKKMLISEFQLKITVLQGNYQTEILSLNKKIEEYKLLQRAAKQSERRKDREISQLRTDVEKSERMVGQLTDKLELCGVRLRNMQQQQSNFKGVIQALESKIKVQNSQQRKNEVQFDKQAFETRSNFSIKTFTFR